MSSQDLVNVIRSEIERAQHEGRDFSFSATIKAEMLEKYGLDPVCDTLLHEIRRVNMPCIDPFESNQNITSLIDRVKKEAAKLSTQESVTWTYKGEFPNSVKGPLLSPSTTSGMLSTYFNGYERYHEKCHKAPTPAENWAKDESVRKRIVKNLTHPGNVKEALSRNRLRVGCMQLYGCHYPTAFPISVALFIYQREACRRIEGGRLACVIDPCAGWGDRLAAAMISGVVDHFVAIDPWTVSNILSRRVYDKLGSSLQWPKAPSPLSPTVLTVLSHGAETDVKWPDADLVFTSPPYAQLECYNYLGALDFDSAAGTEGGDGQAWRFKNFRDDFLVPLMENSAKSIRARRGRVMINIANTPKSAGGENLIRDLLYAAELANLKWVETIGMTLSTRMKSHKTGGVRAEPIFVFE